MLLVWVVPNMGDLNWSSAYFKLLTLEVIMVSWSEDKNAQQGSVFSTKSTIFIYIEILDVLTSFCAERKFIFLLHRSLSTQSKSLIPLSLIPVVTSCIHEFRGLPFLRLPGGPHSKFLLGSLSWSILCTWPCQFKQSTIIPKKLVYILEGEAKHINK